MKISMDKKYKYRNGEPARIIGLNGIGHRPVVSLTMFGDYLTHFEDGTISGPGTEMHYDLVEDKPKRTFYRRKWVLYDVSLITDLWFKPSEEEFDKAYDNADERSDEWETIEI